MSSPPDMDRAGQVQALQRLKGDPGSHRVPIRVGAETAGWLEAVGLESIADDDLIHDLVRWRAGAMSSFLTVFAPSEEATRNYLRKLAVGGADRVLFIVHDDRGNRIGNIGLCDVAEGSAELDNVLRGEPSPRPGFMRAALAALAVWAAETLGCGSIHLKVIGGNGGAIAAYEKAGFAEVQSTPLKQEPIDGGGYRLVPCPDRDPERCEVLVTMRADVERLAAG